jgi:hypothetical protein
MVSIAAYGGLSRVEKGDGSVVDTTLSAAIILRGPGQVPNEVFGTMTTVTTNAAGEQVDYRFVDISGDATSTGSAGLGASWTGSGAAGGPAPPAS